ncbi:MAG: hypothetical protein ABWX58_06130 [Psychrobacillus psychrotolerans]
MTKKNNKNNNKSNSLDREEYGFGYDVSPDDLEVYVQNNNRQKKKNNEIKDQANNKQGNK